AVGGATTAEPATTLAPTPTTLAPTPTTEHPGTAAVAAYHASRAVYVEAAQFPHPDHPGLAQTLTGPVLERVRDALDARRRSGRASRFPGPRDVRATDTGARNDMVVLSVCYVDDGILYEKATGRVVNDDVVTLYSEVLMAFEGGRWKEYDSVLRDEKPGRFPCAG
ncbi:MAG: hypothetical protein ACRD0F_03590, partial [Acidimicrobiales bacterium]